MERKMERMSLENNEQEEEEELIFSTPPSSPAKENVAQRKQVPRSLARSTSKKNTRQVQYLRKRVEELQECELSKGCSFLVHTWNYEFGDVANRISKDFNPDQNTAILLSRVKLVYELFKAAFVAVSGVYVGKSVNTRVRFNHHQRNKSKEGHMLAMVAIEVFTGDDVPEQDRVRWKMNAETLGLHYERLLTEAVKEVMPVYDDSEETGGGGRIANVDNVKETCLYMLLTVSNEE